VGNQIIIRLAVNKLSAAVGYDVMGTTATGTQVIAQIEIGALGSGLFFPADTGTGANFRIEP
jgi:hypothetical protein